MGIRRLLRRLAAIPSDALLASSTTLPARLHGAAMADPSLAAKFYPYQKDSSSFVVLAPSTEQEQSGGRLLPIPPQWLWMGYGDTPEQYLESGRASFEHITRVTSASGFSFEAAMRILDFGCASGRTLRWFHDLSGRCEPWGVDILDECIMWCQRHLSPPFRFAATTSFPHLPFEDEYFDFIYTESVFTHIADLADMWLLELRRILRPGGRLGITLHDNHTIALVLNPDHPDHASLGRMLLSRINKPPS
jgi:SAM-dependent methyltransferase